MIDKLTTIEIEERVAQYFGPRQSLIVPNISWGMNIHECDLLIVRKSGYGIEVEIKISRADLKKDAEKTHHHNDSRIREFYFAIPDYLQDSIEFIPKHAGIIVVNRVYNYGDHVYCRIIRDAEVNKKCTKFTEAEMFNIARLGTMRIWSLKRKIIETRRKKKQKSIKNYKEQLSLSI
jgi:hypothetical protein